MGEFSTLQKKRGIKFGVLETDIRAKKKKTASVVEKLMKVHLLMFQA